MLHQSVRLLRRMAQLALDVHPGPRVMHSSVRTGAGLSAVSASEERPSSYRAITLHSSHVPRSWLPSFIGFRPSETPRGPGADEVPREAPGPRAYPWGPRSFPPPGPRRAQRRQLSGSHDRLVVMLADLGEEIIRRWPSSRVRPRSPPGRGCAGRRADLPLRSASTLPATVERASPVATASSARECVLQLGDRVQSTRSRPAVSPRPGRGGSTPTHLRRARELVPARFARWPPTRLPQLSVGNCRAPRRPARRPAPDRPSGGSPT